LALSGPATERPVLFLVGDPKQSIYGWRSADLRAYDGFVTAVLAAGGVRHVLSVNYRSLPTILAEVSRAVAPIMQRVDGLQPAFQPLISSPSRSAAERHRSSPAVEYWVAAAWDAEAQQPAHSGRAVEANLLEARALAADLRRVHDAEGVPWREIGVLFRSGGDLDIYLGALREAGVPYLVEGDRQYYERREVIDGAALLRTILEPHDQLALLTLLRSPMIGVPDAALLPLWSRGFPGAVAALNDLAPGPLEAIAALIAAAATDLPPDIDGIERLRGWEHQLTRASAAIAALRLSFATEPVDVFVERLRTAFLLEAIEASRRLGAYRLANLERFFRQLLAALGQGDIDPQQLMRRLRTAIAQRVDAEEERPGDGAEDAVRVLTIHRAKGLDFTHVYVMQLHKEPGTTWGAPVDIGAHGEGSEYRLFAGRTLGFWTVEARRAAVAAAEQVRTLYVAMTRAKSRLVLSGKWPADRTPVSAERARSQVRLLLSRQPQPPDLDALMVTAARARSAHVDEDDIRWVFPALVPPRDGEQRRSAFTVEVAVVQAAADRLQDLTNAAARRATRPFIAAVTAGAALLDLEQSITVTGDGAVRSARVARAAGIVVHAILETCAPDADPRTGLRVDEQRLRNLLRAQFTLDEANESLTVADELLTRFAAGPCGARFRAIAEHIVARELPVLIPPTDPDGPVGCATGAIDLLYRDPGTAEFVVADYKTDHVESDAEIAQHIAAYHVQGAHYVRAVREALQLDTPPRFELWFLHPGRIEVINS
jgi:ATP-dependent helicase/nuclease subunit A